MVGSLHHKAEGRVSWKSWPFPKKQICTIFSTVFHVFRTILAIFTPFSKFYFFLNSNIWWIVSLSANIPNIIAFSCTFFFVCWKGWLKKMLMNSCYFICGRKFPRGGVTIGELWGVIFCGEGGGCFQWEDFPRKKFLQEFSRDNFSNTFELKGMVNIKTCGGIFRIFFFFFVVSFFEIAGTCGE